MRVLIRSHSKFPYPEVIDGKVLIHAGLVATRMFLIPQEGQRIVIVVAGGLLKLNTSRR